MAPLGDPAAPQRRLSVLVVHEELPTYDRQSGSLRLQRYVEFMVADGHRVTFLARAGWQQERYADELRALGVEVHPIDYRRLRAEGHAIAGCGVDMRLLLARGRFDIAYLNFYGTAERYLPEIRAFSPATRILIDTHDVHHLRERRGAELAGDEAGLAAAERTRRREAAIYSQADLLTAVSVDDARALRELAPDVPIEIVTNVHLDVPTGPGFDDRSGLVFVANFDHKPNVDAILDFHTSSWPVVSRALPNASLTIVGWAPPPEVRALHGGPIVVTGQVPEVAPYLDAARVSIAPLRYGAGVKGKIGEALMHGLPVVTTTIGAEGMDLVDGEHVLIAEPGEELGEAIVRLHEDRELWSRLSSNGRAHVDARHGVAAGVASLRRAFASAVPPCFVASAGDWTPAAARSLVGGYLEAFAEGDAVTLVVPVPPEGDGASPQEMCELLGGAIAESGADPEHVPDIAVMPCAGPAPLPSRAVAVDVGAVAELDWAAAAAAAMAPGDAFAGSDGVSAGDGGRTGAPRASIIIPAYGRREMTERCLAALARGLGDRLGDEIELVLVDNASPDSTLTLFREWADRATVVELPRNLNFAGGVNAGARAARGAVLVVVSTDMELGAGAIDALVEEALKPGVGLVGARMRYPDGTLQHAGIAWRGAPGAMIPFHIFHHESGELPAARATYEIDTVTGGCIAVRADLFRLVGGFDEGYVNGWEDSDLCLAIRSTGAAVRSVGGLDVIHHEGVTSGARYDGHDNPRRFLDRWAPMLVDCSPMLRDTFGAVLNPLVTTRPRPDGLGEGAVEVVGPVAGIGPRSAEARAILSALTCAGIDPSARTVAPTWVGPALDEDRWLALAHAHWRPPATDARTISFGAGAETGWLRAGSAVPARGGDVIALASCPAVAEGLRAAGWPAQAVELLAPVAIQGAEGGGGDGVLALMPTHDAELTRELLAQLRELGDAALSVLPLVRTPELGRILRELLPAARLLAPTTDERRLAELAARHDLVIAVDPADEFDRCALTAAASGAAVIVRADGPAAWVLGDLAVTVDLASGHRRIAWDDRGEALTADGREARAEAVRRACGPAASASALAGLLSGRDVRAAA